MSNETPTQCGDDRFEIIEAAKKRLLKATNIESSPKEMEVLDSLLFRMWQMGWLPKLAEQKKEVNYDNETIKDILDELRGGGCFRVMLGWQDNKRLFNEYADRIAKAYDRGWALARDLGRIDGECDSMERAAEALEKYCEEKEKQRAVPTHNFDRFKNPWDARKAFEKEKSIYSHIEQEQFMCEWLYARPKQPTNRDKYKTEEEARKAFDSFYFGPTEPEFYEENFQCWLNEEAKSNG